MPCRRQNQMIGDRDPQHAAMEAHAALPDLTGICQGAARNRLGW